MLITVSVHASDVASVDMHEKIACVTPTPLLSLPICLMSVKMGRCVLHGYVAQIRT